MRPLSPLALSPLRITVAALVVLIHATAASAQPETAAVVFGARHALALRTNGDVVSWGDNVMCQLGRATRGNTSATPALVLRNITAIAAAADHSLALAADGKVYGWGMNPEGALGTGLTNDECEGPVVIESLAGQTVTHIATGVGFSVAVTSTGDLYCTGDNSMGQCPAAPKNGDLTSFARVTMPGLTGKVAAVAAGAFHTLLLTTDGAVHAFGRGRDGQLGNGQTTNGTAVVSGLSNVVAIAAGMWHSAAVRADGSVWLWGNNQKSQLCDATNTNRAVPARVEQLPASVSITSVAAGAHATLLRASNGALYACGDNQFGALGSGRPAVLATPALIAPASHAAALAVGGANGAFSTDGCDVHIAGDNDKGIVSANGNAAAVPFTPRANLSLCAARAATPLRTVVNEAPRGGVSDCWTPRHEEDAAGHAKFATMRQAALAAEAIVDRSPAFHAAPEPVRLRASISAGPIHQNARLHVKAVPERKRDGTRLWGRDCTVIPQIDRVGGAINQISIFINPDPRGPFISPAGLAPKLTGRVSGYPEYNGWVLITKDGRLPWMPQTLADKLDEEGAHRQKALAEQKRFNTADPAMIALHEKQLADYEAYRASFTAAELQMPAVSGDPTGAGRDRLNAEAAARRQTLGREAAAPLALDALAQYELRNIRPGDGAQAMGVKPDPAFVDPTDPNRVQLIAIRFSEDPDPKQTARRAWQQQVKDTFDFAALAALLSR